MTTKEVLQVNGWFWMIIWTLMITSYVINLPSVLLFLHNWLLNLVEQYLIFILDVTKHQKYQSYVLLLVFCCGIEILATS